VTIVPKAPIFTDDAATDQGYINVRAASNDHMRQARENCELLWEFYEELADNEFRTELRTNFDARYWEMYLTTTLMFEGYGVCCPKPGPDVGITVNELRIWFEATSPTRGADGAPDQVPEVRFDGRAYDVPNEKMILRYLNSISEKHRQHAMWLKQGIVRPEDAFVIAINPRRLGHDHADTVPPCILQAGFAVGPQYVVIDRETIKQVDSGFHFRDTIAKASGAIVATGAFQQNQYAVLSALLCSRVDAVNQPEQMGEDFQLAPNPNSIVPLPAEFRLPGTYFKVVRAENGYDVTPVK
jgi:hypothetical protein